MNRCTRKQQTLVIVLGGIFITMTLVIPLIIYGFMAINSPSVYLETTCHYDGYLIISERCGDQNLKYTGQLYYWFPSHDNITIYRELNVYCSDQKAPIVKYFNAHYSKSDEIRKYLPDDDDDLPNDDYLPFISLLKGDKVSQTDLNKMLIGMAKEGNMRGIKYLENLGANIHTRNDYAMRWASENGRLEVVKYLIENGADIHAQDDQALWKAAKYGHLEVVKYLVEQGADIHVDDDYAMRWASRNGHLEVVKYLVEQGADIHARGDTALTWASIKGHLEVVKYLVEQGADIHVEYDHTMRWASHNGHLEVVKYLESLP